MVRFLRIFISIFCLILAAEFCQAQDIIELKNGEKIEAKVIKITDLKIIYKKYINLTGPDYEIVVSKVNKITFENGAEEIFNPKLKEKKTTSGSSEKEDEEEEEEEEFDDDFDEEDDFDYEEPPLNRSFIFSGGINLNNRQIDSKTYPNAKLGIEFQNKNGKLGIYIPIEIGISKNSLNNSGEDLIENNNTSTFENQDLTQILKYVSSGLHLRVYPRGQRKSTYFFGPAIKYHNGEARELLSGNVITGAQIEGFSGLSFEFSNGLLFRATDHLNIYFEGGFGLPMHYGAVTFEFIPIWNLGFGVGLHF